MKYVTVVRLRPSSFRVDPQLELVGRRPCREQQLVVVVVVVVVAAAAAATSSSSSS